MSVLMQDSTVVQVCSTALVLAAADLSTMAAVVSFSNGLYRHKTHPLSNKNNDKPKVVQLIYYCCQAH